jgi:CTP synthase (UTP-ammonia lyase)
VLVEHARNVLGNARAAHAEYGEGGDPVIAPLACSLRGREIEIRLTPGSVTERAYGAPSATEKTTCDYGLRPDLADLAESGGLRIAATDDSGEVRAVERPDHAFFVGTLYQPQLSSRAGAPHPLFAAFLDAARRARLPT